MAEGARRVVSVGYEKKSLKGFCAALADAGVQRLIDVRAVAWSQRPDFRKGALATALADVGIEYVHCKAAGNPYRPKPGQDLDFEHCERLYAAHLDERPSIVSGLLDLVGVGAVAVMCYEALRTRCHRGVLLDRLGSLAPIEVVDL